MEEPVNLGNSDLAAMTLDVVDVCGGRLDVRHAGRGVGGDDKPPTLRWGAWPEASSYAVTCYDPDAPTGSGMWHWVLADLAPTVLELSPDSEALDSAHVFSNDMGVAGYSGAAPPPGPAHRYEFTVWALGIDALPVRPGTTNAVARYFIHQHALAAGRRSLLFGLPT